MDIKIYLVYLVYKPLNDTDGFWEREKKGFASYEATLEFIQTLDFNNVKDLDILTKPVMSYIWGSSMGTFHISCEVLEVLPENKFRIKFFDPYEDGYSTRIVDGDDIYYQKLEEDLY